MAIPDDAIDPAIFPRHKRPGSRYIRCIFCHKEYSVSPHVKADGYTCPACEWAWKEYERCKA
jgi:hypothetical protein